MNQDERSVGGSKMETFDPKNSPEKNYLAHLEANSASEKSPDLFSQSDVFLRKHAMNMNDAAEKFMAELDMSEKKRWNERQRELYSLAAQNAPGSMVTALGHDFFDKEASIDGGLGTQPGTALKDLGNGFTTEGRNNLVPVQVDSQHSRGTSKFMEEQEGATERGEYQNYQRDLNQFVGTNASSPVKQHEVDPDGNIEVAQNTEGTISRYLVGGGVANGHDSVSRGANTNNNTLQRGTGGIENLDSNKKSSYNRESHEQFYSQLRRDSNMESNIGIEGSSSKKQLIQQRSSQIFQGSLQNNQISKFHSSSVKDLSQFQKQAAMKQQSSVTDLHAREKLYRGGEGFQQLEKLSWKNDDKLASANPSERKSIKQENNKNSKLQKNCDAVEDNRYKSVQPLVFHHQNGVNNSNFGIIDIYASEVAIKNSNSKIPSVQSKEIIQISSDVGDHIQESRNEKNDLRGNSHLSGSQIMAQSTLTNAGGEVVNAASNLETFNGQASMNSSMALNQRIRKLREELDNGHTPLISADNIAPASTMPLLNYLQTSSKYATTTTDNYNLNNHGSKSPSRMINEELEKKMRVAQMQSDRLLEKVRSRSPVSGSHVSQISAMYVDTKRSQLAHLKSRAFSNATEVEFNMGKITESQEQSRYTEDQNIRQTYASDDQIPTRDGEHVTRIKEIRLNPGSPEPYQNLNFYQSSGLAADCGNAAKLKDKEEDSGQFGGLESQEQSFDRKASSNSKKRTSNSIQKRRSHQKSTSLRSRNLSYSNINTTNSGIYEIPQIKKSKKTVQSVQGRILVQANRIKNRSGSRSKSVRFSAAVSQRRMKDKCNSTLDLTGTDSAQIDKIYRELIKQERLEFERILKSKEMAVRHDTETKMRKQIQQADQKFKKVTDLERHLAFAQKNTDKLRSDWSKMKQQLAQTRSQVDHWKSENKLLRNKLDDLWQKLEEEKDLVMLVTKSEVEKIKGEEINILKQRIEVLEAEKIQMVEDLTKATQNEKPENRNYEAEISALKAEVQLFRSKCERIEVENKRLKQEIEISQESQMQELRSKYDSMKNKYREIACASATGLRSEIDTQRLKNQIHTDEIINGKIQLDKQLGNQSQPLLNSNYKFNLAISSLEKPVQNSENNDFDGDYQSKSARFQEQLAKDKINITVSNKNELNKQKGSKARGSSRFNTHTAEGGETIYSSQNETFNANKQAGSKEILRRKSRIANNHPYYTEQAPDQKLTKSKDQSEVWQLRCKLLAEKYYTIIKDLKRSLKKLKSSNKAEIERLRKEMSDQVLDQLHGYITRLEQNRTSKITKPKVILDQPTRNQSSSQIRNRSRTGSRKRNHKKISQDTFKSNVNQMSTMNQQMNSDIHHLKEYTNQSSQGTYNKREPGYLDSAPQLKGSDHQLSVMQTVSNATTKIPHVGRNAVTPAFNSKEQEIVDIETQKRDLEEMINQQQRQIDEQQEELENLKRRVSQSTPGEGRCQDGRQTGHTQSLADQENYQDNENISMDYTGRKQVPIQEIQFTMGEAIQSDTHLFQKQMKSEGSFTHDSKQAALASNPSSVMQSATGVGGLSQITNAATSIFSNRAQNKGSVGTQGLPMSSAEYQGQIFETKGVFNHTQRIQPTRSGSRPSDRSLSPESNLPYRSKFGQNYNRLVSLTGGQASAHLSLDQKIHLDKIRSQYSSASGSRDRGIHQTAIINGQQHNMVSLRAPLHKSGSFNNQQSSSYNVNISSNNVVNSTHGSQRHGGLSGGNTVGILKEPRINSSNPSSTNPIVGSSIGMYKGGLNTQPTAQDYAIVAQNMMMNVSKVSRSPYRSGDSRPHQLLPQVLEGSPNSPFQEHLSKLRALSGQKDGVRSDNERSHSMTGQDIHQKTVDQINSLQSNLSPNAGIEMNPSTLANIYQLRSETQSEVAKIDATLSRLQNINQITSNLPSPPQEEYISGNLNKQTGGYPMHFQPPEYFMVQEEDIARPPSNNEGPEGNVSFQHTPPPDNTLSLAKFAQKEQTLSLDKFAQRMGQSEVTPSGQGEVRDTSQLESLDRTSRIQSNKSEQGIISTGSNIDATEKRQPYHGVATQNNQQNSVPNLKTTSLRSREIDGQQAIAILNILESQKSSQINNYEQLRMGRASSNKSGKKSSKRQSRGQSINSIQSGKRSTKQQSPQAINKIRQNLINKKNGSGAERSKSSIKSIKQKASQSKSPKGQKRQSYGQSMQKEYFQQYSMDPSQVNSQNITLQQTQNITQSNLNSASATISQNMGGIINANYLGPQFQQNMVDSHNLRNRGSEFQTEIYLQHIAQGGAAQQFLKNQPSQTDIGSSVTSIQQQDNSVQASIQQSSQPGQTHTSGTGSNHMTTFERLNDEIQKSINSLKAMSQQKAFNLHMFNQQQDVTMNNIAKQQIQPSTSTLKANYGGSNWAGMQTNPAVITGNTTNQSFYQNPQNTSVTQAILQPKNMQALTETGTQHHNSQSRLQLGKASTNKISRVSAKTHQGIEDSKSSKNATQGKGYGSVGGQVKRKLKGDGQM